MSANINPQVCSVRQNRTWLLPSTTKLRRLCFYRRLSVHRGGGVCLSAWWDTTPPGEDTPGADTPQEQTPPGTRHTPLGPDTPPRADTPLEQTPPLPRDGHCCGRYASYWNAFLSDYVNVILKFRQLELRALSGQ